MKNVYFCIYILCWTFTKPKINKILCKFNNCLLSLVSPLLFELLFIWSMTSQFWDGFPLSDVRQSVMFFNFSTSFLQFLHLLIFSRLRLEKQESLCQSSRKGRLDKNITTLFWSFSVVEVPPRCPIELDISNVNIEFFYEDFVRLPVTSSID